MAEVGDSEPGELIVASVPEDQKPLVCIEYPGFSRDLDKTISCLGGIQAISRAHYDNHALEMRFRPEDVYCKPAIARSKQVTNLVLKIRRRKIRRPGEEHLGGGGGGGGEEASGARSDAEGGGEGGGGEGEGSRKEGSLPVCSVEVVGLVKTSYEFSAMADFQVLPPGLSKVTHNAELVDPGIVQMLEPFDETFQSSQMPLFLPPQLFSKFDKPCNYALRPDMKPKILENQVSGTARQRRLVFAIGIPFNRKGPVPTEPHPDLPHSNHPKLSAIKQLFEEKPIWSRPGIQSRIKLNNNIIRSLLAHFSYYFTSGPWKTFWVRFGYDPRTSSSSKEYQCLDFRVPKNLVGGVEAKRKSALRTAPQEHKRLFQLTCDQEDSVRLAEEKWAESASTELDESPIFTADRLPLQRQMYYQLCDLHDESLQAIIHSNDGQEIECTEGSGWCEDGVYEHLRKKLIEIIRRTAESQNKASSN